MKKFHFFAIAAGLSYLPLAAAAHLPNLQAVQVTHPIILHANITVPQEVSQTSPKTPARAMGVGTFLFNPKTDVLHYSIDYAGMSSAPFMAHFHYGAPTTNGPIYQTICGKPKPTLLGACPKTNYGVMQGNWTVPKADVDLLLHGDIYVNLHTKLNPNGEIRGQVIPGI